MLGEIPETSTMEQQKLRKVKPKAFPEWADLDKDEYRRRYQNLYYTQKRAEQRALDPGRKRDRTYQDLAHLPFKEYQKEYHRRYASERRKEKETEVLEKIANGEMVSIRKKPVEPYRKDDKEYLLNYMRQYYATNREKMNEQIRVAQKARRAKARAEKV